MDTVSEWVDWDKLMGICSELNNVTMVKGFQIMGVNPIKEADENEKCFIKCMGEGLHFLNSDGTLNDTGVHMPHWYLNDKKVPRAIRRCRRITGDTDCDKAFRQSRCLFIIASS